MEVRDGTKVFSFGFESVLNKYGKCFFKSVGTLTGRFINTWIPVIAFRSGGFFLLVNKSSLLGANDQPAQ